MLESSHTNLSMSVKICQFITGIFTHPCGACNTHPHDWLLKCWRCPITCILFKIMHWISSTLLILTHHCKELFTIFLVFFSPIIFWYYITFVWAVVLGGTVCFHFVHKIWSHNYKLCIYSSFWYLKVSKISFGIWNIMTWRQVMSLLLFSTYLKGCAEIVLHTP